MILPRLISIDTSIFGQLAKDIYSGNSKKSEDAKLVVDFLNENRLIPFITIHHIQEILQHDDKKIVFRRWLLISKFPSVAWMCDFSDSSILGSIVDIHQLEVEHLLHNSAPNLEVLKKAFQKKLVRYSPGELFVENFEDVFSELYQLRNMDTNRNKEIESIVHLQDKGSNEKKLSELYNSKLRKPEEIMSCLDGYELELESKLELRGDIKLGNRPRVARNFVKKLSGSIQTICSDTSTSLYESIIKNSGVRLEQVTPKTTLGELNYLAIYNSKMLQILQSLGIDESRVKDLSPCDSTTWVIWKHLDKAMKYEKRAHGSNMIDKHMSVLALYVDIFTVDKRVKEYFRQLQNKNVVLSQGFGKIIKLAHYGELRNL